MRVFLHKITLSPDESENVIKFKRKQFPIRLAFSLKINKDRNYNNRPGYFINNVVFKEVFLKNRPQNNFF